MQIIKKPKPIDTSKDKPNEIPKITPPSTSMENAWWGFIDLS